MKKKILCLAEAFGFGPASKLINILGMLNLSKEQFDLIFVGEGCALDLCKRFDFTSIYCGSSEELINKPLLMNSINNVEFIISSMEFRGLYQLKKHYDCKIILIDSLMWFWSELPQNYQHVDYYLCQNFFGVDIALEKVPFLYRKHFYVVSPILSKRNDRPKKESGNQNSIIITFGGLENPFLETNEIFEYCKIVFDLINIAAKENTQKKKIFLGNSKFTNMLSKINRDSNSVFLTVPSEQIPKIFQDSSHVFTTSGLETFFEAAFMRKPILFLPPSNNSQLIQLQYYIRKLNYTPDLYDYIWGFDKLEISANPKTSIPKILNSSVNFCYKNKDKLVEQFSAFIKEDAHFIFDTKIFYKNNDDFIFEQLKKILNDHE